ncbi:MAG: DsbA family protein [Thermoanaerobaculia bacterium]
MKFLKFSWIGAAALTAASVSGMPANARAASIVAEVQRFASEYLPWEPDSRVTAKPDPANDLRGLHAFAVERTGKYEKLNLKTGYYVSADEKWIFTGSAVKNNLKPGETSAIETDRDVAGIADYMGGMFRSKAVAHLEPPMDRAGMRGVRVDLDTGYFSQPLHYWIEPDGSAFLMGQFWKLGEPVADQRRAMIDLTHAPSHGVDVPKVTVVEYADMECPFCKKRGQQMDKLVEKYGSKLGIRRYYKFYPLWAGHVWSTKAASAGVCLAASSPDLLFRFKQLCYDNQETLTLTRLDQLVFDFVDAAGLDRKTFLSCYLQASSFDQIRKDMDEGGLLGVNSTPTYYLNGVEIYWLPDEVMEDYLKMLLARKK